MKSRWSAATDNGITFMRKWAVEFLRKSENTYIQFSSEFKLKNGKIKTCNNIIPEKLLNSSQKFNNWIKSLLSTISKLMENNVFNDSFVSQRLCTHLISNSVPVHPVALVLWFLERGMLEIHCFVLQITLPECYLWIRIHSVTHMLYTQGG